MIKQPNLVSQKNMSEARLLIFLKCTVTIKAQKRLDDNAFLYLLFCTEKRSDNMMQTGHKHNQPTSGDVSGDKLHLVNSPYLFTFLFGHQESETKTKQLYDIKAGMTKEAVLKSMNSIMTSCQT